MWRGPLAYGHATAVSTRELMGTTLGVGATTLSRCSPPPRPPPSPPSTTARPWRPSQELVAVPSVGGARPRPRSRRCWPAGWPSSGTTSTTGRWTSTPCARTPTTRARRSSGPRRGGWSGTTGGRDGEDPLPALVLQAHVDVVPPGDPTAWTSDPFAPVRDGDDLVARGSNDMKGGLAAVLAAAAAVRASGVRAGAAVRRALRGRRGGRRAGRLRHPAARPPRRRLRHPRADRAWTWSRPTPAR